MLIDVDATSSHGVIQAIAGLLPQETIDQAVHQATEQQRHLLPYLIHEKLLSATQIAQAIAHHFGLEYVDLHSYPLKHFPIHLIRQELLTQYVLLPLATKQQTLILAISDPTYFHSVEEIKFQ